MNGIHDLGGMDGFTLPARDQGRVLKEEWEREIWGLSLALGSLPGLTSMRPEIEAIPPAVYLSLPYFGRWLYARERMLIDAGYVTAEELADPAGPMEMSVLPAGFSKAGPAEVVARLGQDVSTQLESTVAPRFSIGDIVSVRNEHPAGHTRAPRYVRGRSGTVARHHGVHRFDDKLPRGADPGPQNLYTVVFTGPELWGRRGHVNDRIHVELWEYHLEQPDRA